MVMAVRDPTIKVLYLINEAGMDCVLTGVELDIYRRRAFPSQAALGGIPQHLAVHRSVTAHTGAACGLLPLRLCGSPAASTRRFNTPLQPASTLALSLLFFPAEP